MSQVKKGDKLIECARLYPDGGGSYGGHEYIKKDERVVGVTVRKNTRTKSWRVYQIVRKKEGANVSSQFSTKAGA